MAARPASRTSASTRSSPTYVDLTRRQYIGVWPQAKRGEWQACAALSVPRQVIADIEADPGRWQALREDVAEGVVVDFQRDMLPA